MFFWNEHEFILRYMMQNISIHNFLKAHNIPHLFFDAFYESYDECMGTTHGILDSIDLIQSIKQYIPVMDTTYDPNIKDEFLKIYDTNFVKITFKQFITNQTRGLTSSSTLDSLFDEYHPTELSHNYWATYLQTQLIEKIKEDETRS